MKKTIRFGQWLIEKEKISVKQLEKALDKQQGTNIRLGAMLSEMGILSVAEVTQLLSEYFKVDYFTSESFATIDLDVARKLPEPVSRRFSALVAQEEGNFMTVVMVDPLNVLAIDTIQSKLKCDVRVAIAAEDDINRGIESVYHGSDLAERQLRDIVELEVDSEEEGSDDVFEQDLSSESEAGKAPVIRFVDLMLSQAIKSRASDIHVEPQEKTMLIRMRVDGQLQKMFPPPRKMQSAILTRLKILAQMNITERRVPQDGRFKVKLSGKAIDVRVNSIPTIYGEKIVMRILDQSALKHDLKSIGFEDDLLECFIDALSKPHGIIIVTGPTGSGKSTTLYSALNYLLDPKKNITTVEDPVEYRLAGVNQVQIRSEIGLTFASCLRAILRQDPDIILLGEIRDKETMDIAMKAALTGHLVLSTFHTNDAPSAISRLLYMGLEPYLLASALNLVVAQRLIRRICERCKVPAEVDEKSLRRLKIPAEVAEKSTFYKGKGCEFCNGTGYRGRMPIFEMLTFESEIRDMIVAKATESEIRKASRAKGFGGLMESGVTRVLAGYTTVEEVLAVTFTNE
ncbi:MAG: GspE/PulE family protein [Sedimentisphaeraceae bacterium JB056]